MTREDALLLEKVLTAHRRRAPDGSIQPSPAWADLSPPARREAFEEALKLRRLERALDPRGLSSTAHAVLGRLRR